MLTEAAAVEAAEAVRDRGEMLRRLGQCVVGLTSRWTETVGVLNYWYPWLTFEDRCVCVCVYVCVCAWVCVLLR